MEISSGLLLFFVFFFFFSSKAAREGASAPAQDHPLCHGRVERWVWGSCRTETLHLGKQVTLLCEANSSKGACLGLFFFCQS